MRDYNELLTVLRACTSKDVGCMKCPRLSTKSFANDCAMSAVRDAADAIEELLAAVPKWISVEERLPKPFVDVLVKYNHGDELSIDCVDKNGRWQMLDTSHWMPLPAPSKEVLPDGEV